MQAVRLRWLGAALLGWTSLHGGAETLIVSNVNGYAPSATAWQSFNGMVVRDGKVANLLVAGQTPPKVPGAIALDGRGATLLPGLIDAHGHVLGLGQERLQVGLRGTTSVEQALERVRAFAASNRDDAW
jgi:predicted amidohydrolase YtcJ